jgi:adenylate cyclase
MAAIEPNLVLAEIERARRKPTDNLVAYDWCLRALPLVMTSASLAEVQQTIAWLRRALDADPDYAYAMALRLGARDGRRQQLVEQCPGRSGAATRRPSRAPRRNAIA